MTGAGTPRVVVQKILNHVETGVTAVYDRYSYDSEKRVALDGWGRQVAVILANEQATPKVLEILKGLGGFGIGEDGKLILRTSEGRTIIATSAA
jgi:hypothetical protein